MKLHISSSSLVASTFLALGASVTDCAAFSGHAAVHSSRRSPTQLRFTEWDAEMSETASAARGGPVDPSKMQDYLPTPSAAAARPNLDGTVLVSGFANNKDRSDQRIFDLLNHEESAFTFDKIVAFVDDVPFAKKRLISRSARYSGLLNKLDFLQAETTSALPTPEQLEGVKHWVAHAGSSLALVTQIGALLKSSPNDVENVSVLLSGVSENDVYESQMAVEALLSASSETTTFTIIATGQECHDTVEGTHPYAVTDFGTTGGTIPSGSTFSRDEGVRLAAECLGLQCSSNRALTFTEVRDSVNATETKLITGLREAGYEWSQELEHMIEGGASKYDDAVKEYEKKRERGEVQAQHGNGAFAIAEEKYQQAVKDEEAAQAARETEWLREREVAIETERIKAEDGLAEWA